ncbi:MAG: mechanosensitive ion channel domain-containing protein [Bacteroidota bacterium]
MKTIRSLLFIIGYGLFLQGFTFGQSVSPALSKGEIQQPEALKLSEIPSRSVNLVSKTRESILSLVRTGTLEAVKARNDLIRAKIDTSLFKTINRNDTLISLLTLESRKISLQQQERIIDKEEKHLREILQSLEDLMNMLKQEEAVWKNTRLQLHKDSLNTPVTRNLVTTIVFIDSALSLIDRKSEMMIEILEKTITLSLKIDLALQRTVERIKRAELNSFAKDQVPLFGMDFRKDYPDAVTHALQTFKKVKLKELGDYLLVHQPLIIISLLLFLALLALFYILKRRVHLSLQGYGKFYREMLLVLISKPLSAAALLTLSAVAFIFPDRPYIFRELIVFITIYPLFNLLNRILDRKYQVYLYVFGFIILMYLFIILILSDIVIARLMYLIVAVAEAGLLGMMLVKLWKSIGKGFLGNLVLIFIAFNLALAITGLVSNLSGRVVLTFMAINAVFINILSAMMFYVAIIMLDGIVVLGIDSHQGRKLNILNLYGEKIKEWSILILNMLTVFFWFMEFLRAFHLDNYATELVISFFTYKFVIGTASFSLDIVLLFFAVIFGAYFLARFLQLILENDVLNRLPLSKGLPHTIAMSVKYSLVISGFFLAFTATGIPMDKFTLILGAFSVGVGFGLQKIFSNIVSGLILLFERPIQLGDTVQVGPLIGRVKSIDLRSSNIHTFDGSEVIVPNEQLVSNEVINWTLSDMKRRVKVPLSVSIDSDPFLVQSLVMEILDNHAKILKDPKPLVYFTLVGQSSLDFELLFWISEKGEGRSTKSDVLFGVFKKLKENNVKVPIPRRDINIINPSINDSL